jgi:hypothetical protein
MLGMKIMIMLCVLASIVLSCSDDSEPSIDVKAISGIWVPYEVKYTDLTIEHGPFTARSMFGAYAESVQLNNDKTFVPVIWTDKDNYVLKTDEGGSLEYVSKGGRLFFTNGAWDMEFKITKYGNDELWLTYKGGEEGLSLLGDVRTQYRFRREIGQ